MAYLNPPPPIPHTKQVYVLQGKMRVRNNDGRKQTSSGFLGSHLITSSESLWGPQEGLWSGHGCQRSDPLQLLFENLFWQLRTVEEAWRLGSMLCCYCVGTCVCRGYLVRSCWMVCVCVCAQCMHSSCIWNVRFLTSMLSGMCFGYYFLFQNQTSDGSPCECLANSYTCYFPSVECTQGSFIQFIMSRNMQIRGGDPLPEMKPISFF